MKKRYLYVNVNEDDVPYDAHNTLVEALAIQEQFPNDFIVEVVVVREMA